GLSGAHRTACDLCRFRARTASRDRAGGEGRFSAKHPRTAELVIEVCVTSIEYDRSKLRAYASAGVKECWLVVQPQKQIEVLLRPSGDRFAECTVHGPGGILTSAAVPSF